MPVHPSHIELLSHLFTARSTRATERSDSLDTATRDVAEVRANEARDDLPVATGLSGSALALVLLASFMVVLDFSIVNVALPAIRQALGFGGNSVQWVVTAYAITFGGLLVLGGRHSRATPDVRGGSHRLRRCLLRHLGADGHHRCSRIRRGGLRYRSPTSRRRLCRRAGLWQQGAS